MQGRANVVNYAHHIADSQSQAVVRIADRTVS